MDYDQLASFLEVAKLQSFSRAAEKIFRTQPAINALVRLLEQECCGAPQRAHEMLGELTSDPWVVSP